jgi:putative ABC transport system permease protein
MRHLLRLISVRYLRAAPGRTFLTLFGIMLGVAVVFAIDIVNNTVGGSFRSTIDNIAGKTALIVRSPSGVEEPLLETVRAVQGVKTAVPIVEQSARDKKTGTQLMVLGVDTLSDSEVRDYEVTADDVKIEDDVAFLNDPKAVIVTQSYAKRHSLKVGDTLQLETVQGTQEFTIRGMLLPRGPAKVFGGDLLLMDVYAAELAFGLDKRFDHIDVVPEAGADVDKLRASIELALEKRAEVVRPERRSKEADRLMAGFQLGLSLASLVAMFVGGFIVYNALAIAVAQRKREIGILRALGATRSQMMMLFIGEGLALGAIGALAGLGFGLLLARSVLGAVTSTVSSLYATVDTERLSVSPENVIAAVSLGVAAAFVAAFFPARQAAYIEPASAMRKKMDSGGVNVSTTAASLKAAGAAALVAAIVAVVAHVREDPIIGYAVAGILSFSAAFLAPAIARGVGALLRSTSVRVGPAALLGNTSFVRNAGRNSVAIAALGLSLASVVNADAFVGSMKHSASRWVDRAVRADVMVFAARKVSSKADHPLPASVGAELSAIPGVQAVDYYRSKRHNLDGQPFNLASFDLENYRKYNEVPLVAGNWQDAMPALENGTGLAASESFTRSFKVGLGDSVKLQTPDGERTFKIVLVYVDFNGELGILLTTRKVYVETWKDTLVDSFSLYLRKGVSVSKVRDEVAKGVGSRYGVMALSNGDYKTEMLRMIESTFAVTRATELVSIIVAVLGIINTLLVTVLDRRTEIGVLKAIGADRKQIRQMVMTEGSLIGLCSTVVGIGFGTLFSVYIVKELMFFQVGWKLDWILSGLVLLEVFVIAQVVSLLATWWPMRHAVKVDAVEALQYE